MVTKLLLFLAVLPFTFTQSATAGTQQELMRLQKCYGLFVRERISATDPLWLQVQNNSKTGTAACMEIFDRGKLGSNGEIKKLANGDYDYEGMRVLNTFLHFHNSQILIPDYSPSIGNSPRRYTRDVIDTNEAAYHFVYSLFANNAKYSEVFTRESSLRSVRYSQKSDRAVSVTGSPMMDFKQGVYKWQPYLDYNIGVPDPTKGGVGPFNPTLVETGILVGIVADTRNNSLSPPHEEYITGSKGLNFSSSNVTQHLGAGVLGAQSYLLANWGLDDFSNGGSVLQRRWGKNVYLDFFCRELPVLRSADVIAEVDTTSSLSYRTGISCMGCHSSMDPIAGVLRNAKPSYTHGFTQENLGATVRFIGTRPHDLPALPFPSKQNDSSFYRRPAQGRLMYRSYDGTLVKKEVEGVQELAAEMVKTNDLYVCAAKRYYKFLTGINVSLQDIGDYNTPQMTVGELQQRNRVIDLGMGLKQHQSLRTLIQMIIASNSFIYPDRGI